MVLWRVLETCQSGRMCLLAKEVGRKPSWVRIPPSPQSLSEAKSFVETNEVPTHFVCGIRRAQRIPSQQARSRAGVAEIFERRREKYL